MQNGSVVSCSGVTGSSLTLSVSSIPASCTGSCAPTSGTLTVTPALVSCDELEWLKFTPVNLSAADGTAIAVAVAAVWIIAWVWRALARTLNIDGERD
jgi:hypothetical protein